MKKLIFLFTLLFTLNLLSNTFFADFSIGSKFNSNIQYLYILEKLSAIKQLHKKGLYISNTIDLSWTKNSTSLFLLQYSLMSETYFKELELSEFNHYISATYGKNLNKNTTFDINLQAHQSMENYKSLKPMFFDILLESELFYDFSKTLTYYLNISTTYFSNTSNKIKELKGPAFSLSNAISYYPSNNETEIKITTGTSIYFFRNYDKIRCLDCSDFYKITNKYTKLWFTAVSLLDFTKIKIYISSGISYFYWLDKDIWQKTMQKFKKRRRDTLISSQIAIYFTTTKNITTKISYQFNDNISDTGKYKLDYTNYSFLQHILFITLKWHYEVTN